MFGHIFHFLECIKSTIPQNLNIREFVLLFFPFYSAPSALSIMSEWFCIINKKRVIKTEGRRGLHILNWEKAQLSFKLRF